MKKFLLLFCGGLFIVYLSSLIYIGIHIRTNTAHSSDAIVILGARSYANNKVNPCLAARVEKGVSLYKNDQAPYIIMSGGDDFYDKDNQAELMATLAEQQGVPAKAIVMEKASANTYENLLFTKEIMKKRHLSSVIIVSDPYHLPRAALVARTLHMDYSLAPAANSPCWSTYTFLSFDYFRDGLALLQYIATGKIRLLTRE